MSTGLGLPSILPLPIQSSRTLPLFCSSGRSVSTSFVTCYRTSSAVCRVNVCEIDRMTLAPVFSAGLRFARNQILARGLESASDAELASEVAQSKAKVQSEVEADLEADIESEKLGIGRRNSEETERSKFSTREGAEYVLFRFRRFGGGLETRLTYRVGDSSLVSTMLELLDLEKQFSFYGSYHNNKVNIFIHALFVWPIFYTSLILWAYSPALISLSLPGGTLPLQEYMVLNWSFVQAAFYALYYIALDRKAGSLGAAMCLACWIGANAVAQALPWSLSWKIVLASQVICWVAQVYGHQKFEGRAPALLDNLPQAFLMAPFFVLLECLQIFSYEPYPGFQKKVQENVDVAIRKFRASKGKKAA